MKKIGLVILIFAVITAVTYFSRVEKETFVKPLPQGKVSFSAQSINDLVKNAEVIVEAKATGKKKNISFLKADFVQTEMEILEVYKGSDIKKGETLQLLQTVMVQDPLVVEGEKVLLFLNKYYGEVTSDQAYVTVGLYQGHYKIKNNELRPSLELGGALKEDFENYKYYDKMVGKIKEALK